MMLEHDGLLCRYFVTTLVLSVIILRVVIRLLMAKNCTIFSVYCLAVGNFVLIFNFMI